MLTKLREKLAFKLLSPKGDVLVFKRRLTSREVNTVRAYLHEYIKADTEQPQVHPSLVGIRVEGNVVHAEQGKFPTFTAALHDLVDQWDAHPGWTHKDFLAGVTQLEAEWY